MRNEDKLALARNLQYVFKNTDLLDQALSHRSVQQELNNERMEFLGDAIVNFIMAQALFERFPTATEGQLTRLRANMVNQETLAEIAEELVVGEYLNLGVGELKSGGAKRPSILADAVEAIIAAIYLDSNLDKCQDAVIKWYQSRLDHMKLDDTQKDPKTLLQEYLQGQRMPLPVYRILSIDGPPHDQNFCVECEVQGVEERPQGHGKSRRRAEQDAARLTLTLLSSDAKQA